MSSEAVAQCIAEHTDWFASLINEKFHCNVKISKLELIELAKLFGYVSYTWLVKIYYENATTTNEVPDSLVAKMASYGKQYDINKAVKGHTNMTCPITHDIINIV